MKRIVRMVGGQVTAEWRLDANEILIGRGGDCQIQLNDPSVSRHHAKVTRIYSEHFIEDLNSTNGVVLNGRRVGKHVLKTGDLVQIGTHDLKLVAEQQPVPDDSGETLLLQRPPSLHQRPRTVAPPPQAQPLGQAFVRYLSGINQGEPQPVDKALYTIGRPGGNLAVISRRAQGYFLLHLGGNPITQLNGNPVHGAGVKLSAGDQIQVGDMELEFFFEALPPAED